MLELFLVNVTAVFHPIPAEPTIAILLDQHVSLLLVLIVVIVGSFIGAAIGYLIGKYGLRRIIPFHDSERDERAQQWFRKYGGVLLLASPWIPFAGDLVSLVAGMENYDASRFIVIIFTAKIIKGTALVYFIAFFLQFSGLHL